jgi:hypothetical protein
MLTIGDWTVSGEIVAAIVAAISWIMAGIVAIVNRDEEPFQYPLVLTILIGVGYLMLKNILK